MSEAQKTPTQEVHHKAIYPNRDIIMMRDIGLKYGVTLDVVALEGQEYRHENRDPKTSGTIGTLTGTVPKGSSDVVIRSQKKDMGDFWNAVGTAKAKRTTRKSY